MNKKDYKKEIANNKSKVKDWFEVKDEVIAGKWPMYMNKLQRKKCRSIGKIRSKMLPIKENQEMETGSQKYRFYNAAKETQRHLIDECPMMHDMVVRDKNCEILTKVTDYIKIIESKIENTGVTSPRE